MSDVLRAYVEKKDGFDIGAKDTCADLKENLGLPALEKVRIIHRYDVEGLDRLQFERAVKLVLSEPNADNIYYQMPDLDGGRAFATEYLPGQYDQKADSASQCIALLTGDMRPDVVCADIYVISGDIDSDDFARIQAYLINPLETRIASFDIPDTLRMKVTVPTTVDTVRDFTAFGEERIRDYHKKMGFAMNIEDLIYCRNYFRDEERRDPTVTELRVIDTYWSDHCRHTTFLTKLSGIECRPGELASGIEAAKFDYTMARNDLYAGRNKDMSLMDLGTIGAKVIKKRGALPDIDVSDEINACSINAKVDEDGKDEDWLIEFKNETHNHPTEIEPFGGAATCLGGAIRDPLSMRAYVYQAMRITGAGNINTPFEKTMHGKLPQKKISRGAAHGYSSYGNQIGLATGQVTELYDDGYVAKRMEIGAVIGAVRKENVIREEPLPGDKIILLGGRTGRDGCGGATGSSKAHNTASIDTCGAEVQKGNPPTERKIQRLFRNKSVDLMIKRCNDFGAGGVSVAIGELAPGLLIDLDTVPKKYEGLDGTELAISESQERMAVVVSPADTDRFLKEAEKENLEATVVATVTSDARLSMKWCGSKIVDISRAFLDTNGVTQNASAVIDPPVKEEYYREKIPAAVKGIGGKQALINDLSRLDTGCQKGLAEMFDASIGASTVLMPFAGKYQLSPEPAMAAKIPVGMGHTDTATAMSYGFIPGLSKWSPFHGASYAVAISLAKLACIGADPSKARLTFQEYFERLGSDPSRWGKPAAALLGALSAQLGYNTPAIGGKDSMSGSFNELDVPPTLVSFALSMTKASQTVSGAFKKAGDKIYYIGLPTDLNTLLPDYERSMELFMQICSMTRSGKIGAAGVVEEGGAAALACKMAFGEKFGICFEQGIPEKFMYAPLCGSFVIETDDDSILSGYEKLLLGTLTSDGTYTIGNDTASSDELINAWMSPLKAVYPAYSSIKADMPEDIPLYEKRSTASPVIKIAKPKAVIPVFPGTNCEYDSAKAFIDAGAEAQIIVIRNLTPKDIDESTKEFAQAVKDAQIIMIPGGFSGGDEPDGSGKFIATTLRNPMISDAVNDLLKNRSGLMLGICNGFQALIKTGLVPYGEIKPVKETDPTLTFNYIGRHISTVVYTRVTSALSPWMSLCSAGDIHAVPISHGEGRFTADMRTIHELSANGQIATQYVDLNGAPSADPRFSPNGSICAIEGITSPDGRVLGKMGHSERAGRDIIKNVPGDKDQKLFASGVAYFK